MCEYGLPLIHSLLVSLFFLFPSPSLSHTLSPSHCLILSLSLSSLIAYILSSSLSSLSLSLLPYRIHALLVSVFFLFPSPPVLRTLSPHHCLLSLSLSILIAHALSPSLSSFAFPFLPVPLYSFLYSNECSFHHRQLQLIN